MCIFAAVVLRHRSRRLSAPYADSIRDYPDAAATTFHRLCSRSVISFISAISSPEAMQNVDQADWDVPPACEPRTSLHSFTSDTSSMLSGVNWMNGLHAVSARGSRRRQSRASRTHPTVISSSGLYFALRTRAVAGGELVQMTPLVFSALLPS